MNQNPYEPTKSPLVDQREAVVSWRRALAVWWSAAWRGGLYAIPGGFLFGMLGGVLAAVTGAPQKAQLYAAIGGYLASIPLSMLALKQALTKHVGSLIAAQGVVSPNNSLERTREG